jgi:hypothetical protein
VNEFVRDPRARCRAGRIAPAQRAAIRLYTGAYPDGCCPGRVDHERLAKDTSDRPLNAEAVDAAKRGSIAWVRLLMQDQSIPWGIVTGHKVDGAVGKRFLRELDATFLTSSSIIVWHSDGPRRQAHPAGRRPRARKADGRSGAPLVFGQYSMNLGVIDNPTNFPALLVWIPPLSR